MLWPTDILSIESWVFICSVVLLSRYYLHRKWSVLKNYNIPHDPPSLLKLGNALSLYFDGNSTYELERKKKYGPVWGRYTITKACVVVHDPEILRQICIKEFSKFSDREGKMTRVKAKEIGNGLFSVNGEEWKRIRKTLAPTFSTLKLRQMSGIINFCVDNTLKVFEAKIKKEDGCFVTMDVFKRLSLDVICSTAFSTDVNSQDEGKEEPPISKSAKDLVKRGLIDLYVILAVSFPFLGPLFTWVGGRNPSVRYMRRVCQRLMDQRGGENCKNTRVDLLQLMMDAKVSESELRKGCLKGLNSTEIIGNAMTMLIAGYETSGITMTFLAYNLAMHPEVQEKLLEEIDESFREKGRIDYDTSNELKYLDMCVNESLRLYSPVSRTLRMVKKETTVSGVTFPRGCMVSIPLRALCHDPEFWDAPMEFNPERMRNMDEIDPIIFQPFGQGPRNCVGMRFAIMEVKLAFCKILRHFTLEPTSETPKPPLRLASNLIASPKVDFKLRVVPRS